MITNKDIRVDNGNLVINGDKYPLDGQSPETIMEIVEDNSDTTPTENSTAPITSGGVYTALGTKQDTLTFDSAPTDESTNPVTSGGVYTAIDAVNTTIGDLTQTGVTGATVAAQISNIGVKGTWTPKIYDVDTYKTDIPGNQYYVKIGDLYIMFIDGTFDYSNITTAVEIKNLPCNNCIGGTIYLGGLKQAAIGVVGNTVQGVGNAAVFRPNVVSDNFVTPGAAPNNRIVLFGVD